MVVLTNNAKRTLNQGSIEVMEPYPDISILQFQGQEEAIPFCCCQPQSNYVANLIALEHAAPTRLMMT
jgi:hypothetical protein